MKKCGLFIIISNMLLLLHTLNAHKQNSKEAMKFDASPQEALKNLGAFFQMVSGNGNNSCEFECPEGLVPVPKKGHVPSTNGCGSMGIKLDTSAFPAFEVCCDKHDRCYDTCRQKRDRCDTEFDKCLDNVCNKVKQRGSSERVTICESSAGVMKAAATGLGCTAYKTAQQKACECKPGGYSKYGDDGVDNSVRNGDPDDNDDEDSDDDDNDDEDDDDDDYDDNDNMDNTKSTEQEPSEDFFDKVDL